VVILKVYPCTDSWAIASGAASPVLARSLSAIAYFAKDRDTLIEEYYNKYI